VDSVEIYLDDNVPEYMMGRYRIGSVISYDSKGNEIKNHQELVDNTEFDGCDGNDFRQEIIDYVALKLGVSKGIIKIMN